MLNKIIIINSELYSKASIQIGQSSSIQIAAENNVGKSSFINTLNFLYITDKKEMRFEDNKTLSDSMNHYFENSLHSFIVFEIFKNGYFCILVKATPENTIEYYKITGAYDEQHFFDFNENQGFRPLKWEEIGKNLTLQNPTSSPQKLTNEDFYNLVYNTNKAKNPVVVLSRTAKRNRRSFSNNFTDIYRNLIGTSTINEKAFKKALLVASNLENESLDVLSGTSFDKIDEFERKKIHLENLIAVKKQFENLKLLNDEFISLEAILGKLKHTFLKKFDEITYQLSDKIRDSSELSISIRTLKTKIDVNLKKERDELFKRKITDENEAKRLKECNEGIDKKIDEIKEYEPTTDNLLYQGLKGKYEENNRKLTKIISQINQLERSKFTRKELEYSIEKLIREISDKEGAVRRFDKLLYQKISDNNKIRNRVYTYLRSEVAELDESKIQNNISNANDLLTFFDGQINVSEVVLKKPPSIDEYKHTISVLKKELSEKTSQLDVLKNREKVESEVEQLRRKISKNQQLIEKIENKPDLRQELARNLEKIKKLNQIITETNGEITDKDEEIKKTEIALNLKKNELENCKSQLNEYKKQYQDISDKDDIYEIEEKVDISFDNIKDNFNKKYNNFSKIKEKRKDLKDDSNRRLNKDIRDIKSFIREVNEEIQNIPQTEKVINSLLNMLSHEIGNPTHTFLSKFDDFKGFVYKNYNRKLAEYPISNIQEVKVKIEENEDLVEDLRLIANLKLLGGLDFENSIDASKEALKRQISMRTGKRGFKLEDLFKINVEITKVTGKKEVIDLSRQVQSRGTNIILKLYLFLNIIKELVQSSPDNKVVIYVDELDAIGAKNVKHLIKFCKINHFVPIFAAPRKIEGGGIEKYYVIKEPPKRKDSQRQKISFGERQSLIVKYKNAE